MMNNMNLFTAPHIVLTAIEAEDDAAALAQWTSDSRYIPLSHEKPPYPMSEMQAKAAPSPRAAPVTSTVFPFNALASITPLLP